MLIVFLSFIYLGLTSFLMGTGIKILVEKIFSYEIKDFTSLCFAGLGFSTVYSGIFSLFYKVGALANLLLCFLCILICIFGRKSLLQYWEEGKERITGKKLIYWLFITLLFSYGSSRGYLHFDTGLYHAQAIRWIEEYGVVPGLANLHCRLAYNSSAFVLTALYSFQFLLGRSLHTVSGFMALLLALKALELKHIFHKKKVMISDFVKVSALFYLSVIYTEMMSPASDYFAMILLFFILIRWIELEERRVKEITPYCLLCVLLAVTVTIKLSAAIMLLLVIKPAFYLLKEKKYMEIGIYLGSGLAAVFPYLARNVILSGWLVYPFAGVDLFSVDWKIPVGEVLYDSEEIKVYAKGMTDVLLKDLPMEQWLPGWFSALKTLEKLWVCSSLLSIGLVLLAALYYIAKRQREKYPYLFLGMILITGYLFWQVGTPLVRYGYIYILAFPFYTVGIWYDLLLKNRKKTYVLFWIFLLGLGLYKGKNLVQDIVRYGKQDNYVWQQDYHTGEVKTYEVEGKEFYIPMEQGQIGYEKFPGVPYERYDFELRGEDLKEGFRRK